MFLAGYPRENQCRYVGVQYLDGVGYDPGGWHLTQAGTSRLVIASLCLRAFAIDSRCTHGFPQVWAMLL